MADKDRTAIYTPGHGPVADTLIMHGLLRALAHMGIYDVWVERIGERYRIEFAGRPRRLADTDVGEAILRSVKIYLTEGVPLGPLRKIFAASPKADHREWATDLAQAVPNADLLELTEDHKAKRREGRGKNPAHPPLYLPLGPEFGRWRQEGFSAEGGVHYRVCDTCFALANIGLAYGAAVLAAKSGSGVDAVLASPAPAGRVRAADLLLLQRVFEGYREVERPMPAAAAPLYWLSVGETLYDGAEVDFVVWRIAKVGNYIRVLGVETVPGRGLMEFAAEVKLRAPRWPAVAARLAKHAPEALARLAELALYGGDAYSAIKELASLGCGGEPCLGDVAGALAEVLAEWRPL